jgi:hypothetical protein
MRGAIVPSSSAEFSHGQPDNDEYFLQSKAIPIARRQNSIPGIPLGRTDFEGPYLSLFAFPQFPKDFLNLLGILYSNE